MLQRIVRMLRSARKLGKPAITYSLQKLDPFEGQSFDNNPYESPNRIHSYRLSNTSKLHQKRALNCHFTD